MNVREILVNKIIQAMEDGVVPWRKPWQRFVNRNITGREYHGFNRLVLSMSGYSNPYWLTFNQARKNGIKIRQGARGIPIMYYKMVVKETIDDTGTEEIVSFPMLRYYYVFNIEQRENVPEKYLNFGNDNNTIILDAEKVVENMPDKPIIKFGGDRACYNLLADEIKIPPLEAFDASEYFYLTLFHELGHSTGHEKRLNRKMSHHFGDNVYSQEELVAELTAAFLGNACGFDEKYFVQPSAAYIQSWLKVLRQHPRYIINAASQAEKAYNYILNKEPNDDGEQSE